MYKYQCSKETCSKTWTLQEGKLNGFALTCPHCGKGRGIFIEQLKKSDTMEIKVKAPGVTMKI